MQLERHQSTVTAQLNADSPAPPSAHRPTPTARHLLSRPLLVPLPLSLWPSALVCALTQAQTNTEKNITIKYKKCK